MFLVLIFTRGWVDPRAMEQSEGDMPLKNPVTLPRIDPGTVGLVTQHLNHYATPGPRRSHKGLIFSRHKPCLIIVTSKLWSVRDAVYFGRCMIMFRRNVLPPSSRYHCCHSSGLRIDVADVSETLVPIRQFARCQGHENCNINIYYHWKFICCTVNRTDTVRIM
jgi:hypothetical protein